MDVDCTDMLQQLFTHSDWQEIYRMPEQRLMAVAQARAEDMAHRDYFDHEDPDGVWPNYWVRQSGVSLPEWYPDDSNQVESIARGYRTPLDALTALVASEDHHDHMTGKGFWHNHAMFGVGCGKRDLDRYYVIITAPRRFDLFIPAVMKRARELGGTLGYTSGGFPKVVYLPKVERLIVNP